MNVLCVACILNRIKTGRPSLYRRIPENNFYAVQIIESPFEHLISIKNRFTLFICLLQMQQWLNRFAIVTWHFRHSKKKNKFKQVYSRCPIQKDKLFDPDLLYMFDSSPMFFRLEQKKIFHMGLIYCIDFSSLIYSTTLYRIYYMAKSLKHGNCEISLGLPHKKKHRKFPL